MTKKSGFTLVEMLIVIVIIGILAAALIPRVTGLQARARDAGREVEMRNVALALELYYIDHGEYPGYQPPQLLMYNTPILVASRLNQAGDNGGLCQCEDTQGENYCGRIQCSQEGLTRGENIGTIGSQEFQEAMQDYIRSIPTDRGNGLSSSIRLRDNDINQLLQASQREDEGGIRGNEGLSTSGRTGCEKTGGDYFAYSTDGLNFAITSLKESKKGNTNNCFGHETEFYDSAEMGFYQNIIYQNGTELQQAEQGVLQLLE